MIQTLTALALVLAAPLNGNSDLEGSADAVLVRYDLEAALTTYDTGFEESLLLSAGNAHIDRHRTRLEGRYDEQSPDAVVNVLTRLLGEELEYEGRFVHLTDDNNLLVMAPAEVQARVKAVLAAIEGAVAGAVVLQVDIVSIAEGAQPFGGRSVVDADQVDGMLAAARGPRETYRLRTVAGRTSILHRMERIALVADADVEIAHGSAIHDPVLGFAEAGTRILARSAATPGGVLLAMFYANGSPLQDAPVRTEVPLESFVAKDNGVDYAMAIRAHESVEILFRSLALNTFVPDGKALVIGSEIDLAGERDRQAVVIRRVGGGATAFRSEDGGSQGRRLFMINTEAFEPPTVRTGGRVQQEYDEYESDCPSMRAEMASGSSVFLYDWISSRFSTWRTFGPWILCVYDPSWDGNAAEELERLLATWGPDASVRQLDLTTRSRGHGGEVPVRWSLPVRMGTDCGAMAGISGTLLNDYDVEVAQLAAAGDPQHRPVFNGLAFRSRPAIASGGHLSVGLLALAHLQRGPARDVELGGPLMKIVQQATYDELAVDERLRILSGGGSVVLGDAGTDSALSLEIGIR